MKKAIYILAFAAISIVSCKKKIDGLPDATQTGAHTFGAKVDGALWVPQSFGPFNDPTILEAFFIVSNGDLRINARNFSKSPTETEFEIFLKDATTPGTYLLNTDVTYPSSAASYGYYIKRNITPQDEWITTSTNTGVVTITKVDSVNKFVSGTFSFQAKSIYDPSKLITIAEGRFDVKTD